MRNLSIGNKLKLLVLPLLLSVLAYYASNLKENYQIWQQQSLTEKLIYQSITLGDLIHTLQIERGASTGFVRSGGAKFSNELVGFQRNTDQRLEAASALYRQLQSSGLPENISESVNSALAGLQMLMDTRQGILGLSIHYKDIGKRYTDAIAAILATTNIISEENNDALVTKMLLAYNAFLNAKELSGQERALLTGIFEVDHFEPGQYQKFLALIAGQQAYQNIFNQYALRQARDRFSAELTSPIFTKVEQLRKIALDKADAGEFAVDSSLWFNSATARIDSMHVVENELAHHIKTVVKDKANAAKEAFWITLIISVFVVLASIGFAYWISSLITGGINSLHFAIDSIAANKDLTVRLQVLSSDEIGQTAHAFNKLMDELQRSIERVDDSAKKVLQYSRSINLGSKKMAASTATLSNSASAMAAAIEQMGASIDQEAEHANHVQNITNDSNQLAERGTHIILKVIDEMNAVAVSVRQSADKMQELNEQSKQIDSIVQVIRDIADQTNLLALNASIEAARAGEQGRGFAVVADEVRNLSKRTTNSVQDIAGMILGMQKVTIEALDSMDVGVSRVTNEVATTQSAGELIRQIQDGTKKVREAVAEICNAIREQSSAGSEIGRQVEQVAQMSEENNVTSLESAKTAQEMENLATQLQSVVALFAVKK